MLGAIAPPLGPTTTMFIETSHNGVPITQFFVCNGQWKENVLKHLFSSCMIPKECQIPSQET